MKQLLIIMILLSLQITAIAELPDPDMPNPKNIKYKQAGKHSLFLDPYYPKNQSKPVPLIIWIHGGGWMVGDKNGYPPLDLTKNRYAMASIDYRLSGDTKFPAQIEDVKSAVRWLRKNAKTYNLDPNNFGA